MGSFALSPVALIAEAMDGQVRPMNQARILELLRQALSVEAELEAFLETSVGISLSELADQLANLFKTDPVSFFCLMNFEFEHLPKGFEAAYPPSKPAKGDRLWAFHKPVPLAKVMMILAELRRVFAIVSYLCARRQIDHMLFRTHCKPKAATKFGRNNRELLSLIDAMPLAIPMLAAALTENQNPFGVGIDEINRLLKPSLQMGNSKRRPMFHYYGLDAVDVVLVGLLEVVRFAREDQNDQPALARCRGQNGSILSLLQLQNLELLIAARWPSLANQITFDRALRAHRVLSLYVDGTDFLGRAYRFDPSLWQSPTIDAQTYQRRAFDKATDLTSFAFDDVVKAVRDAFLIMYGIQCNPKQIQIQIQMAARAACHLTSSTTHFTREPILFLLLEHALSMSGFRTKRSKSCRQSAVPAYPVRPGLVVHHWGTQMSLCDVRGREYPEVPKNSRPLEFYVDGSKSKKL
ncbi:MAG: hypothetical protein ACK519_06405 [Sphingomonadaceae bacterium]|jgi:hypothetical protein